MVLYLLIEIVMILLAFFSEQCIDIAVVSRMKMIGV